MIVLSNGTAALSRHAYYYQVTVKILSILEFSVETYVN